jgi:hypothetical protein
MQLLLMEDQQVVKALSSHTAHKAFTDGIGSWRVIGCFENLDAARCCHASETRAKLVIVIANKILWCLSIGSSLPQVLCGPRVGRKSRHTHMDHSARFEFDDEERKERAKEQVRHLQEIAGPHVLCVSAQERRPVLSSRSRGANASHLFLDGPLTHAHIQLEQLPTDAFGSEDAGCSPPSL